MLEKLGINEQEVVLSSKEIRDLSKQLTKNLDKAKVVFPFTMYGGFKDFSEMGELGTNNKIVEYSQYERVFTGKSSVVAIWDGSVTLENNGGTITKQFAAGKYAVGIAYDFNIGSNIDEFSGDNDFLELHDTEQVNVVFPDLNFTEEDIYKVFVMPQETNRWLRATNILRIRDTNGNLVFTQVSFSSFNSLIADTGLSLYNHIQRSAVGENYAWPKINGDSIEFEILGGDGVNEYQIEILGNALVSGIGMIGRDADSNIVNEPKWLLTSNLLPAIESEIKKASPADNNMTLLHDCEFSLKTYFKNWKDEMSQGYDLEVRKNYEGMFHFDEAKTDAMNTQLVNKNIFNQSLNFQFNNTSSIEIDGLVSHYVGKKLTFGDGQSLTPAKLLNLNVLSYVWLTQLTEEIDQSVAWRTTDVPVIGKLSKFLFGIPVGWRNSQTYVAGTKVNYLASTSQTNLYSKAMFAGNSAAPHGLIPVEAFDNTTDNPIGNITGSKSTTIAFRGKLTDSLNDGAMGTELLGTDGKVVDENTKFDVVNGKYWIIDKFVVHSPTKADYIVTFFKDGIRKWSSRYQTTAKWTNNIRNWLNFVSFSPWTEFMLDQDGINWNSVKPLPVPGGGSFLDAPRQFSGVKKLYETSGITGSGQWMSYSTFLSKIEIIYNVPTSILNNYKNISIVNFEGGKNLLVADFLKRDGENVSNKTPSGKGVTCMLEIKSDVSNTLIKFTYTGVHYDFNEALGNQLSVMYLSND